MTLDTERTEKSEASSYWRVEKDVWGVMRLPSFSLYAISRVTATGGQHLLAAIILWQVYEQSGSVADLGLVGVVRLLPAILMSLLSGAVADGRDMRRVVQLSQAVQLVATLAMLAGLYLGHGQVPLAGIFVLVFVAAVAQSFEAPARQVLLRAVVPDMLYARGLTVNTTLQSFATTLGPAVGGGLIAWGGVGAAYVAHAVLVLTAIISVILIRTVRSSSATRRAVNLGSIVEGLSFVRRHPLLLSVMSLDMFAVIFGGAKALLPVYAIDVLHVGPAGYGILMASLRVGSLAAAFSLMLLPVPERIGRALLVTAGLFGLATMLFGLSTWLPLSLLLYAVVGGADRVSAVMRQNTIQLGTPDALRGRVTAVSQVFSSGSEQLGAMESGFVAALSNAVFSVVSGGAACLVVVCLIAWRVPELRRYRYRF